MGIALGAALLLAGGSLVWRRRRREADRRKHGRPPVGRAWFIG